MLAFTVFGQSLVDVATVGSAKAAEAGFRGGVALEKFAAGTLHHRSVGAIVREFEGRFLGNCGRKTERPSCLGSPKRECRPPRLGFCLKASEWTV